MLCKGHSTISGVGSFLPEQIVKSVDILKSLNTEARFGIPHNWLDTKVGIIERRYAQDHVKPSDLAVEAAERAIVDAGITAEDLDAIIYCGIVGDQIEPSTAHNIQHMLGAKNATCMDVQNACHGFNDGMRIADMMVAVNSADHVLVVTAELTRASRQMYEFLETASSKQEFMEFLGATTVGDAAGAMVISKKLDLASGLQLFNSYSDGKYTELCTYGVIDGKHVGGMIMDKISGMMLRLNGRLLSTTLEALKWTKQSIDHLIMHQVGKRPYEGMVRLLGVEKNKSSMTLDMFGNITTATIPVNFAKVKQQAVLKKGDRCLIIGGGSGVVLSQIGFII